MTTYAELVDDVVDRTNRPDLIRENMTAIRAAIMKFHLADIWKRDIKTIRLDMSLYPSTNFRWEIDVANASVFPQFKRVAFIRVPPESVQQYQLQSAPLDYPWGYPLAQEFKEIAPDAIFDSLYRTELINYFYQAGMSLTLHARATPVFLDIAYYAYPLFQKTGPGTANVSSWIANQFRDAIADEAAGRVYKMIGKDEESQLHRQLFAENLALVRTIDIGEL